MNAEIGTDASQFLCWEYLFRIFGIVSLQCIMPVLQTQYHYVHIKQKRNVRMYDIKK
jgi:hypothetical protein